MALAVLPTGHHYVMTRSLLHIEEAPDTKWLSLYFLPDITT